MLRMETPGQFNYYHNGTKNERNLREIGNGGTAFGIWDDEKPTKNQPYQKTSLSNDLA